MKRLYDIMTMAPVIPVVVIEDQETAVPMAEALVRGGLPVIEVTLRTPASLDAIARIAAHVPSAIVGAGSVLTARQAAQAAEAGAAFLVSPGYTPDLATAVQATGVPYLPGVATVSEIMGALEAGYTALKFFPAALNGGPAALKAIMGPVPEPVFCPTGGITVQTAPDYLKLDNVACVGGSWITPPKMLAAGQWDAIEHLAHESASLMAL